MLSDLIWRHKSCFKWPITLRGRHHNHCFHPNLAQFLNKFYFFFHFCSENIRSSADQDEQLVDNALVHLCLFYLKMRLFSGFCWVCFHRMLLHFPFTNAATYPPLQNLKPFLGWRCTFFSQTFQLFFFNLQELV